jgi:hypothetical protein
MYVCRAHIHMSVTLRCADICNDLDVYHSRIVIVYSNNKFCADFCENQPEFEICRNLIYTCDVQQYGTSFST